ncbi:MAG: hypothetical protein ACJAT7_002582 [Psychromonas sp.]|jgi:hypothetical protein
MKFNSFIELTAAQRAVSSISFKVITTIYNNYHTINLFGNTLI